MVSLFRGRDVQTDIAALIARMDHIENDAIRLLSDRITGVETQTLILGNNISLTQAKTFSCSDMLNKMLTSANSTAGDAESSQQPGALVNLTELLMPPPAPPEEQGLEAPTAPANQYGSGAPSGAPAGSVPDRLTITPPSTPAVAEPEPCAQPQA